MLKTFQWYQESGGVSSCKQCNAAFQEVLDRLASLEAAKQPEPCDCGQEPHVLAKLAEVIAGERCEWIRQSELAELRRAKEAAEQHRDNAVAMWGSEKARADDNQAAATTLERLTHWNVCDIPPVGKVRLIHNESTNGSLAAERDALAAKVAELEKSLVGHKRALSAVENVANSYVEPGPGPHDTVFRMGQRIEALEREKADLERCLSEATDYTDREMRTINEAWQATGQLPFSPGTYATWFREVKQTLLRIPELERRLAELAALRRYAERWNRLPETIRDWALENFTKSDAAIAASKPEPEPPECTQCGEPMSRHSSVRVCRKCREEKT